MSDGSGPGNLSATDVKEWRKTLLIFLIPLFVMYSNQITGAIQFAGFEYTYKNLLSVLVPTPLTIGGIYLYVLNGVTGLLRKFSGDTR